MPTDEPVQEAEVSGRWYDDYTDFREAMIARETASKLYHYLSDPYPFNTEDISLTERTIINNALLCFIEQIDAVKKVMDEVLGAMPPEVSIILNLLQQSSKQAKEAKSNA